MAKMTMEKLESIFNQIIENCSTSDTVEIHNIFCDEVNGNDEIIYKNDEDTINSFFSNAYDALQSAYFGNYSLRDDYMWFNGYGNLESGNYEDEIPIDKSLWFNHFKGDWHSIEEYVDLSDYETAYSLFEDEEEYDEDDFAEYDID